MELAKWTIVRLYDDGFQVWESTEMSFGTKEEAEEYFTYCHETQSEWFEIREMNSEYQYL